MACQPKIFLVLAIICLFELELVSSGQKLEHYGYMEKLYRKCNAPKNVIVTRSQILAKEILPTMMLSKYESVF